MSRSSVTPRLELSALLKGERAGVLEAAHGANDAERLHYRIYVVGNSGSGKTTLSKDLAELFGPEMKRICMDSMFWNDGWVPTPPEVFEEALSSVTKENDDWITDGMYISRREAFWHRATDIIWLDYPLHITFWRCFKRTVIRVFTRERLFGTTCVEGWWITWFSKKSIIWWCLSMHRPLREKMHRIIAEEGWNVKRFTRPEETRAWLDSLSQAMAHQGSLDEE